jgi:hypothetical protein
VLPVAVSGVTAPRVRAVITRLGLSGVEASRIEHLLVMSIPGLGLPAVRLHVGEPASLEQLGPDVETAVRERVAALARRGLPRSTATRSTA